MGDMEEMTAGISGSLNVSLLALNPINNTYSRGVAKPYVVWATKCILSKSLLSPSPSPSPSIGGKTY